MRADRKGARVRKKFRRHSKYRTISQFQLKISLELENNLSDYFKACTYAYYSDYENFIKYYDYEELFDEDDLKFHLCIGIKNSYDFTVKIENSGLYLTAGILSSISAIYIMSNKVCDFTFKYLLSGVWYPNVPTKETCIYLSEKDPRYSLVVKTICVFLVWDDICNKCDKICNADCIYLSALLVRESFCEKKFYCGIQNRRSNYF